MVLILILVRLALFGVFGVAGFAKLRDQRGTREAVINFGAPKEFANALALILPLFEISIASGLLLHKAAWWSAVAAIVLLAIFSAAIGINLARGRAPDCHCFGQVHARPLGWSTLLRNVAFVLGAALIVWGPEAGGTHGLILAAELGGRESLAFIALTMLTLTVAALLIFLESRSKTNAAIVHQHPATTEGLPVGAPAPRFELQTYQRTRSSLGELLNS